jgi:LysM repeat protein
MAAKLILSTVAATALMGASAFAQVQTTETDPRFMPRVYGSTAITGANYGNDTVRTIAAPTQPVESYNTMTNTVRVVEPVTQDLQSIITAPVQYTDNGVVKAQHFKQGDLSTEEYNALLEEADRIRAYQVNNTQYSYGSSQAYTQPAPGVSESYEIELFDTQPGVLEETIIYAETTPITTFSQPAATTAHTVTKGDTLYNISKRYAVTIDELQSANGLYGNTIGLGQVLTIPSSTTIINESAYVAPLTMASTDSIAPVTLVRNVEPVPGQSSGVYAVLPKDTLYSISRRACVKVADLISTNGITNPNTLQPGQRLTMPVGHCLN